MKDTTLTLADIDLSDPDAFLSGPPHDAFSVLRREAPVSFNPEPHGPGFWIVSRYEDIQQVHRNVETFSSELGGVTLEDLDPDQIKPRQTMIDIDSPRHHELRAMINKRFTPRAVAALEDRVRTITRAVLDEAMALGEFDFVERISSEIPTRANAEMVGIPEKCRREVLKLGDHLTSNQDPEYEVKPNAEARLLLGSNPVSAEIVELGRELAAARREVPEDDLVTKLAFEELTPGEYDNYFILLAVGGGGGETTRHAITHGLLALLDHPEQADRLRSDLSVVPSAVEETLRWSSPLYYFRRTATRDVELGGRTISAGDKVTTWLPSGNRDEAVFPNPDTFDVTRSPNRHIAFGPGGIHHCLGAPLARLELKVVFEELLPRLSRIEVIGPPQRLRSNSINGIKRLPVRCA